MSTSPHTYFFQRNHCISDRAVWLRAQSLFHSDITSLSTAYLIYRQSIIHKNTYHIILTTKWPPAKCFAQSSEQHSILYNVRRTNKQTSHILASSMRADIKTFIHRARIQLPIIFAKPSLFWGPSSAPQTSNGNAAATTYTRNATRLFDGVARAPRT